MNGREIHASSMRERLLARGIRELNESGAQNFSIRKIAAACGVSCAAPYKYFKDKNDFIIEILRYINTLWKDRLSSDLEDFSGSLREKIVFASTEYVKFLAENPTLFSIITMRGLSEEQKRQQSLISDVSLSLVHDYCDQVNMNKEDEIRKTYVVRSLIYGAYLLISSGQLPQSEETYCMVRTMIDREFDLG